MIEILIAPGVSRDFQKYRVCLAARCTSGKLLIFVCDKLKKQI